MHSTCGCRPTGDSRMIRLNWIMARATLPPVVFEGADQSCCESRIFWAGKQVAFQRCHWSPSLPQRYCPHDWLAGEVLYHDLF